MSPFQVDKSRTNDQAESEERSQQATLLCPGLLAILELSYQGIDEKLGTKEHKSRREKIIEPSATGVPNEPDFGSMGWVSAG